MKVSQTSAILCSILCLRFWRRPTEDWVSLCSTLFFSCPSLWVKQIIFSLRIILAGVVLWHKWMRPWGHEEQTLTFLHAALPTWGQTAKFSKCPTAPAWMNGSDKTDQDVKVGISNEDRRMNTDSERSGSSPAGTGEARLLFYFILFFIFWNKWTTETSFNKILLSSVPVLFTL